MRRVQRVRIKQVRDGCVRFAVEQISGPGEVYQAVRPYFLGEDREVLAALYLDARNHPVCFNVAAVGALNSARTRAADLLKPALLSNAASLILIHNHPSGDLEPSPDDVSFTRGIEQACRLMGLELHDHLVVTDDGFTSLRSLGLF